MMTAALLATDTPSSSTLAKLIDWMDQATGNERMKIWRTVIQSRRIAARSARNHRIDEHAGIASENDVRILEVTEQGAAATQMDRQILP
jgi:hypothetical protein